MPPDNLVEREPNDRPAQAQALRGSDGDCEPPLSVSGRASARDDAQMLPDGSGRRVQDLYRVEASGPLRITLTVVVDDDEPAALLGQDLDLVVLDAEGSVEVAASAQPAAATELVETEGPGTFLVGVRAASGSAPYLLTAEPLGAVTSAVAGLPAPSAEFVPGEVLVRLRAAGSRARPLAGVLRRRAAAVAIPHGPNFQFAQGTSMAAPHVAGVVAPMLAVNPSLRADDLDLLLAGAHPATMQRIARDLGGGRRPSRWTSAWSRRARSLGTWARSSCCSSIPARSRPGPRTQPPCRRGTRSASRPSRGPSSSSPAPTATTTATSATSAKAAGTSEAQRQVPPGAAGAPFRRVSSP